MKTIYNLLIILFSLLIFSCSSTKEETITQPKEPATIEEIKLPEIIETPIEEPIIEEIPAIPEEDQEYSRAIENSGLDISKETFEIDKSEILSIIAKLDAIMKHRDYASWLNYLTTESRNFWSNQKNLAIVSQRLPIKNYRLKDLKDYFEKVFIPSRIGRVVDEIRYISPTKVKAVQYTKEQDIIYYYFEKIEDRWYLHLDTSL